MTSQVPATSLYIELLKRTLSGYTGSDGVEYHPLNIVDPNWKTAFLYPIDKLLRTRNFAICKIKQVSAFNRFNGYDWPATADTMIGYNRLSNIESCVRTLVKDGVPGDLMEAGVWRGGAAILMRALLKELEVSARKVWAADSFEGLPEPDIKNYPADKESRLHTKRILSAGLDEVKANFKKYDLLDGQVVFLKGWFKDSLAATEVKQLALLRVDADLYESTIQALSNMYPKLSPGGYVIIDDYNAFDFCRRATDDYRKEHGINEKIIEIDREAIYWRKEE